MSPFQQTTRTGLTYGQIISLAGLLSLIFAAWINITNKTTENSIRILALEKDNQRLEINITKFIDDNKQDHIILSNKLDDGTNKIIDFIQTYRR